MSNTNNINIAVEIKPELENVYFVYGCFSYYYQGVILSKAIEKLQSRANKNVLFLNSNQTKSNILNIWIIFKNIAREITYIIVRSVRRTIFPLIFPDLAFFNIWTLKILRFYTDFSIFSLFENAGFLFLCGFCTRSTKEATH